MRCEPWSNENWEDIFVEPTSVPQTPAGELVYFRCHWCGQAANLIVSRRSRLTGHAYTDYACERHARPWLSPRKED